MDQRVDNERPAISPPRAEMKPVSSEAVKKGSWRDTFGKRRGLFTALAIAGPVLLATLILWWLHARQYESTDDAFIDARTVQISAQISAAIVDVPVTDNQLVDAGAVMVRLDPRDFRDQVAQTRAQINQSQANIDNI